MVDSEALVQSKELIDVLDEAGGPTGMTRSRAEVHRNGDWHRVVHLWILTGEGNVLLQRRAKEKDLEPGMVDVTVGGHLCAGEDWLAVLREAQEELSVDLRPDQLHHLTTLRTVRHYPEQIDREYQEVFVCVRDAPLESYRPYCPEVSVLYEVPLKRAIDLYRRGTPVAVAGHDCQGRKNDALLHEGDLIAHARIETVRVLEMAAEWSGSEAGQG